MPKNSHLNRPLMGSDKQFPLGSIVFFYMPGAESRPRGISHVGIVVGFKQGSPQIAHASLTGSLSQAVISRLRERENGYKRYYIVAKPPSSIDCHEIVAIAKSLATQSSKQAAIVKYSKERSAFMNQFVDSLYCQYSSLTDDKKFPLIMREHIRLSFNSYSEKGHHASWYTSLAKMLNYTNPSFDNTSLTHKGWHCVQFVTMVYQIAGLKSGCFKSYYKNNNNGAYSRKHGVAKVLADRRQPFRMHPKSILYPGCIKEFKEKVLSTSLIPLDSKIVSPAALLYYLAHGQENIPPVDKSGPWTLSCSYTSSSKLFADHVEIVKSDFQKSFATLALDDESIGSRRALLSRQRVLLELYSVSSALDIISQKYLSRAVQKPPSRVKGSYKFKVLAMPLLFGKIHKKRKAMEKKRKAKDQKGSKTKKVRVSLGR